MDLIPVNERLKTALSLVGRCKSMADIGSDHGYASIYALQSGTADRIIATDISRPSLEKTERLVEKYGFADRVSCRCGDGLSVLDANEADVALICGMGADLIADIVLSNRKISEKLDFMILQPMNPAEKLRRRLYENGFSIEKEALVFENGKWYSVLKAGYGEKKELSFEEEFIGTFVFREKIPLAAEYILSLKRRYERVLDYVGENDTPAAENGIAEAKKRLKTIEEVFEWAKL